MQGELNQERAKTRLIQARLTSTEAAYHEALNCRQPLALPGAPCAGDASSLGDPAELATFHNDAPRSAWDSAETERYAACAAHMEAGLVNKPSMPMAMSA